MSDIASRTVDREVLTERAEQAIKAVASADRWGRVFRISALGFGTLSVIGTLYLSRRANRGNTKKLPLILCPLTGAALSTAGLFFWSQYRAKGVTRAEARLTQDFKKFEEEDEDAAYEAGLELFEELGKELPHLLKFFDAEDIDQNELDGILSRAAADAKTHGVANKHLKRAAAISGGSIAAITLLFALLAASKRATLSRAILLLGSLPPIASGAGYCTSAAAGAKRRQKTETKLLARGLKSRQGDAHELIAQLDEVGAALTELKLVVPAVTPEEFEQILERCPKLASLTVRSRLVPVGDVPSLSRLKLKTLRVKGQANLSVKDLASLPRKLKRLELPEYLPENDAGSLSNHKKLINLGLGRCNDAGLAQLLQLPQLKKLKIENLREVDHPEMLYELPGSVEKLVVPTLPERAGGLTDPLRGLRTLHITDPDQESVESFKALPRLTRVKLDDGFYLGADLSWLRQWHMLDELKVKNLWMSDLEVEALEGVSDFCVFYISGQKTHLEKSELGQALEIRARRVVTIKRLHPYGQ